MSAHVLRHEQLAITSYNYYKLANEKRPAPVVLTNQSLVDQPHQAFHHQTPARIGKVQSIQSFLCIDKSPPGLSLHYCNGRFLVLLYALDQSQRTVSSDQSQQWGLAERRGLKRLILWNALHESFSNHLRMRSNYTDFLRKQVFFCLACM